MNIVCMFSKAEELVLATCTGTLAIEKARLQPPEHCRLHGCEKGFTYSQDGHPPLVEGHAKPVLRPVSNMAGSLEGSEEIEVLVKEMAAIA